MKLEDVKIGMKVVPHSKSINSSLEISLHWRNAKKQGYLYVTRIDEDIIILNANKEGSTGDYFCASDFEPYIEPYDFRVGDIVTSIRGYFWLRHYEAEIIGFEDGRAKLRKTKDLGTDAHNQWKDIRWSLNNLKLIRRPEQKKTCAFIEQGYRNFLFELPSDLNIKVGDTVLCDTMKGETTGTVISILTIEEHQLKPIIDGIGAYLPLKKVIGKVTYSDIYDLPY